MPVPNPTAELLKSVLTVIVAFLLKLGLQAIGVEIDSALFNTIVAAIVIYFLTLAGYGVGNKFAPRFFK
jgi:hypothetical protein